MRRFIIWKSSGTHADVFAAGGVADLLEDLARCTISDEGVRFLIETDRELAADDLSGLDGKPGYKYLQTKPGAPLPRGVKDADALDREQQRLKFNRQREARKAARAAPGLGADVDADAPDPEWPLYRALDQLQGHKSANKAAVAILQQGPEAWRATLIQALDKLTRGEVMPLNWRVNLVQVFNPQAAKGYARLKPDSTDRNDPTKNAWGEPLLERLKYRGYFRLACPFFLGKDLRLLSPVPERIQVRFLQRVVGELRKLSMYGSAPKVDCLAVLALARLLIEHSEEYQGPDAWLPPAKLVSGVTVAHYQFMGRERAVTGLDRLAVPDWFPMSGPAQAERWRETLEEHQKVIRSLNDGRSDEIGLLIAYRRFLQARGRKAAEALISFLGDYGVFLMRERERDKTRKLKQFLTTHVRRIVVMQEPDYQEILENPGFKAVAAAIRSATVSAQASKRMGAADYRDIRYDLLPELRRKRSLPDPAAFLEAICDFVASYNAESARRYEMNKSTGTGRVSTEELESFLSLLSKHKAPVLGALLCAYASCRRPREVEPGEEAEVEQSVEVENA